MTELQVAIALAALVLTLLVALGGCLWAIVGMKVAAVAVEVHRISQERDAYRTMAEQGVVGLEQVANTNRVQRGQRPLTPLPAIIPHHDSPVTQRNQDAADMGDLRARMAMVAVELDLAFPSPPTMDYAPGVEPRSRGRHAQ